MTSGNYVRVAEPDLKRFMIEVFRKAGVPAGQADDSADILSWASLHGVDTHGIRNLQHFYLDPIEAGNIPKVSQVEIEYSTPISARMNGNNGLGLAAAAWAMRYAIRQAEQYGMCMVTMHNSNHIGALGYYPMMAVNEGMIGVAMTGFFFANRQRWGVLPTFASEPRLSTNPLSFGFPAGKEAPFLLDMATSIVPMNRIDLHKELEESIPTGWGLDGGGQVTTNPAEVEMLLPLGGSREYGGHKGYGLGLLVETLCAVLSGGWTQNLGNSNNEPAFSQKKYAHFFAAIRLDLFRSPEEFRRDMDGLIKAIHATPVQTGQEKVYYPGEPEFLTAQSRRSTGIPISARLWRELEDLAQRYQVAVPGQASDD